MNIITLMIIMVKTTIIVILYCLKRNTNNEAKLNVIYICWSKTIRLQLLFTSSKQLLHEKNLEKYKSNIQTNF